VENYRLPKTEAARQALAATIGADGQHLLSAVDAAAQQPELAQLPTVQILRQVWAAQYITEDGCMRLGSAAELPPSAEQVCSPYDPEARYSKKRDVTPPVAPPPAASQSDRQEAMVGYKVQVTETCDPTCEGPHVITNVETTPATVPDDNMLAVVHQSLETRGLLPGEHLVDTRKSAGFRWATRTRACWWAASSATASPSSAPLLTTRAGRHAWTTD
jgi:hypothetical protein